MRIRALVDDISAQSKGLSRSEDRETPSHGLFVVHRSGAGDAAPPRSVEKAIKGRHTAPPSAIPNSYSPVYFSLPQQRPVIPAQGPRRLTAGLIELSSDSSTKHASWQNHSSITFLPESGRWSIRSDRRARLGPKLKRAARILASPARPHPLINVLYHNDLRRMTGQFASNSDTGRPTITQQRMYSVTLKRPNPCGLVTLKRR
jgi:hypothetical protein